MARAHTQQRTDRRSPNHRAPTACDTPASTAASSLALPAAIAAQNCRRSSRPATGGRPGETNGARPDRSERRLRLVIATPSLRCCDNHLSPRGYALIKMMALSQHHQHGDLYRDIAEAAGGRGFGKVVGQWLFAVGGMFAGFWLRPSTGHRSMTWPCKSRPRRPVLGIQADSEWMVPALRRPRDQPTPPTLKPCRRASARQKEEV